MTVGEEYQIILTREVALCRRCLGIFDLNGHVKRLCVQQNADDHQEDNRGN